MLSGRFVDMSEKIFQRGLKKFLAKQFLAPWPPSIFWVNSELFFTGDRVKFRTEYRRKSARPPIAVSPAATVEKTDIVN